MTDAAVADPVTGVPSVIETKRRRVSWLAIAMLVLGVLVLGTVAVYALFGSLSLKGVGKAAEGNETVVLASQRKGGLRQFGGAVPPPAETKSVETAPPAPAPIPAPVAGKTFSAAPAAEARPVQPIEVITSGAQRQQGQAAGSRGADDGGSLFVTEPAKGAAPPCGQPQGEFGVSGVASAPASDLETTQRSLSTYRASLTNLVERLSQQQSGTGSGGSGAQVPVPTVAGATGAQGAQAAAGGLFGGQLQASNTARAAAGSLGDRSLVMPKGTTFTCALTTRVISATSGLVGCTVLRNVYSADGVTVLIDRGSHMDGEYRIVTVRPGVTRIPTIWTRVRTPEGVVADLDSPATGPLGESGIGGDVDNRWMARIGVALLVGFLDGAMRAAIADAANRGSSGSTTVISSTGQQVANLPERILESTINIAPLITAPQGAMVGVYVARDVDFSSVYSLRVKGTR
jgi:type IV secretion system protein VirB10